MKNLLNFTLFIILSVQLGCLPGTPSNNRTKKSSATTDIDDATDQTFQDDLLFWYNQEKVKGTITINSSHNTEIFLRGKSIHDFLSNNSNNTKLYCLAANYSNPLAKKHFRFKATPIRRVENGIAERIFKLSVHNEVENMNLCSGTGQLISSDNIAGADVTTADTSFKMEDVCPTCTGRVLSDRISLYNSNGTIAKTDLVPSSNIDFTGINLQISIGSIVTGPGGQCSNESCDAKEFDCCIDQTTCAMHETNRPNATTQPDYLQSRADMVEDYSNIKNYPHLYFLCPNKPISTSTPTDTTTNPNDEAELKLAEDIKLFNCLEEGKKENPDFATTNVCEPSFDETSFKTIRSSVWKRCGCKASPLPTELDNGVCPNYGLELISDSTGRTIRVECTVPPTLNDVPFQELDLQVSTKSIPHRFFRSDNGLSVDDIATITSELPKVIQEGEEFTYVDNINFLEAINGDFNINSIFGQMDVALNKAIPAKTINVEFDQTYVIAATSGIYTPCPTCSLDGWNSSYSSHPAPTSTTGSGLEALGHETSREDFSVSRDKGNYEDTIFNRACWVPPTMIPHSHKKNADLQTQRLNRLKTQSAFFVNGYQKDWYGFNKGALIGSFDGVKWFAIGKGRRVRATTKKLFVAINGGFSDLGSNGNIRISITTDSSIIGGGTDTVANHDFDPNLGLFAPEQNSAATCQKYHSCEVDSDCVTQLGWEYKCLDVTKFKTKWPKYNSSADETVNDEFEGLTINQMLQIALPNGSRKRCVYRGAGSLCKRNYEADVDANKQAHLSCAPNFYCASLSSGLFNSEVARDPILSDVILRGQEANYLGRPLNYVSASNSLDPEIIENIEYSGSLYTDDQSDLGLCRPGKLLGNSNLITQHSARDPQGRTDYISQVSSCDSEQSGDTRIQTCPIIGEDEDNTTTFGNYLTTFDATTGHMQNSCGKESQYQDTSGDFVSSFQDIELDTIGNISDFAESKVAEHACLRRPGAICHTDLDCSPNRLHADSASILDKSHFGGNEAERLYWTESLICGQAQEKPAIFDESYDLTQNRCCREIGSTLTMFTPGSNIVNTDLGDDNPTLDASILPHNDPTTAGRYSRYVASNVQSAPNGAATTPYAQTPNVQNNTTPKEFQWKALNDTARKTCCGGGWIRKFEDDSHDWSETNRYNLDFTNFTCINYQNPLTTKRPEEVDEDNYNKDFNLLCLAPADGGCIQKEIDGIGTIFNVQNPATLAGSTTATMDTTPSQALTISDVSELQFIPQTVTNEVPYQPVAYKNPIYNITSFNPQNYFVDRSVNEGVSFFLPIYIGGITNINSVSLLYKDSSGSTLYGGARSVTPAFGTGDCSAIVGWQNPGLNLAAEETFCLAKDETGLFDVFHIRSKTVAPQNDWAYAGVQINFNVMGAPNYNHTTPGDTSFSNAMKAGNAAYYLTKLARLELNGIPQIAHEPVYCSDNKDNLVPGIFDQAQTRAEFEAAGYSYNYDGTVNGRNLENIYSASNPGADSVANPNRNVVFQNKLSTDKVFSSNEFVCCMELGQATNDKTKCCSNTTKQNTDGQNVCGLPSGADLHVYLNRFVSGDGTNPDSAGGGFKDTDFIPETGEPKLNIGVYNKIKIFAAEHCVSGKVRKGAAFAKYFSQPNPGAYIQLGPIDNSRKFSIVDSSFDSFDPNADNDSNVSDDAGSTIVGATQFRAGFKWNHHFYCE